MTIETGGDAGGSGSSAATESTSEATSTRQGTRTPAEGSEAEETATEGRAGGVEALRAELVGERRARQEAQKSFDAFKQQIFDTFAALTGQKPGDGPVTVEALGQQLAEMQTQQAERETETRARQIRAEVKGAAKAAGFHDPTDALARIDLTQVPISDEGEVDSEYIAEQLKTIAERSPYLVARPDESITDPRDSGVGAAGRPTNPGVGQQRIAAGLATSGRSRRK